MSILGEAQQTAEKFAIVIARALQVDVEIVDADLRRVAGTGRFAGRVGQRIDEAGDVYRRVLALGQPLIIHEPGFAEVCRECPRWQNCDELFEMSTPVMLDGRAAGGIGFVCFTPEQKARILENFDVYFDFLEQMAEMLAAKLRERLEQSAGRTVGMLFDIFVDKVGEGVMLLNAENRIIRCNTAAVEILELVPKDNALSRQHRALQDTQNMAPVQLRPLSRGEYKIGLGERSFYVTGEEYPLPPEEGARLFIFQRSRSSQHGRTGTLGLDVFIGESGALEVLKEHIRRFANASATVLVVGESGTGKELVARALHNEGRRSGGMFVPVNCSAIPESLLESELFGYVGGAFTGADPRGRRGKFEQAQGGTLFLDEIGDIPLHLQPKLLRVLEDRTVYRVGSGTAIPVDVRIVAATNRRLEQMVAEGTFREDLFYRLNVLRIGVPPLRERERDVVLLAAHFLQGCFDELGKTLISVRESFWQALLAHHWPGNVRELQNAMEYVATMADSPCVVTGDMLIRPGYDERDSAFGTVLHLPTLERQAITRALAPYGGSSATRQDKALAAAKLGMGIATLYRKLKQYELENS